MLETFHKLFNGGSRDFLSKEQDFRKLSYYLLRRRMTQWPVMIILRQEWQTGTSYLLFENVSFDGSFLCHDDVMRWWSSYDNMMIVILSYDDHHDPLVSFATYDTWHWIHIIFISFPTNYKMLVCSSFDWVTSAGDDEIMSGPSAISPVGSLKHLQ